MEKRVEDENKDAVPEQENKEASVEKAEGVQKETEEVLVTENREDAVHTDPAATLPESDRLAKTSRFDGNIESGKKEESKYLPYTKTRISTIPLQSHPDRVPVKKVRKKRKWKLFSFKRGPKKPKYKYDRDEYMAGSIKTVCAIVIALIVAAFLAFMFVRGVIDIFALGKSEHQVQVELEEYCGVKEIAEILHEKGVIRYPTLFRLWAILKNDTNRNFEAGVYIVSPSMNYDDLLDVFVPSDYERTQITIKIPEGSSVDDVIDIFIANGIGTREGFAEVINHHEFDAEKYWFLPHIPEYDDPSLWRLEGFCIPTPISSTATVRN